MEQGEKIYIESLMTDEEWRQRVRNYPKTSILAMKPSFFDSEFKWRYKMGPSLTKQEIETFNKGIEELRKFLIKMHKEEALKV
jgi:hypothetical protein